MSSTWRYTNTMAQGKQYTLPFKNQPSELVEIAPKERKVDKHVGLKYLQDQIVRHQMEMQMLKAHQKENIQNLLNVEIERDKLRADLEAAEMNRTHTSSLICFVQMLMNGVDEHTSKRGQKRIKEQMKQRCPGDLLDQVCTLVSSEVTAGNKLSKLTTSALT